MKTTPKILVTTAGATSVPTATRLLERGLFVRVLVRRRDARAEIVVGALGDFDDVARALVGVQRAYLALPFSPHMLTYGLTFAAAAQRAHLETVVVLSQWLADPQHPSAATRAHWLTDRIMSWLPDVGVTTINPGYFADNYMGAIGYMAQLGVMPLPLGHGLNAPVSNEDIARVVVGALVDPASHAGRMYRPTGPRLLSPTEIVATFARVLERPVRYAPILPEWMIPRAVRLAGYDLFTAAQARHYLRDYRRNAFAIGAPTDVVRLVGGQPPEDFETTVRRSVAEKAEGRRAVGPTLKTLATFMTIPLVPLPNLARLEAEWAPPIRGRYASDSPIWLASHEDRRVAAVSQ